MLVFAHDETNMGKDAMKRSIVLTIVFLLLSHSARSISKEEALKVLFLKEGATGEEIKKAYSRLAQTWHPDKTQDKKKKKEFTEKFNQIREAYQALTKTTSEDDDLQYDKKI